MSRRLSPQAMFRQGGAIASWTERRLMRSRSDGAPAGIEEMAIRLSRAVLSSDCMDRAWATRWFLARRGISSRVIVGVRLASKKRGSWEGHAWLEVEREASWFVEPGAGYKEIARES